MKALAIALFATILLSACVTPYQKYGTGLSSLTTGYSDTQIDSNTFLVTFRGNSDTSREIVEKYLFRRCAELTVQSGYDYFVTVNRDTQSSNQSTINTPAPIFLRSNRSNTVSGIFGPTVSFSSGRYTAEATIKIYKGEKPLDNVNAFDAREVLRFLNSESGG
jgi:hypothetical protein